MAAEQGTRQGRSGQAGLQVARLLGGILDPAARRRGFAEASLLADWATIVGPALARRCQPVRVDYAPGRRSGGTLLLQVGGAAALEIQHAAPQLLERINAYFGHKAVRQLRLMQMPLPPHSRRATAAAAEPGARGRGRPRRRGHRGRGRLPAGGPAGARPDRERQPAMTWRACPARAANL